MTKPIVRIHNSETNEIIDREMTDSEFTKYQEEQKQLEIFQTEEAAKITARQIILDKLGLTEEEARLLLG